jgi:hypothetical protein
LGCEATNNGTTNSNKVVLHALEPGARAQNTSRTDARQSRPMCHSACRQDSARLFRGGLTLWSQGKLVGEGAEESFSFVSFCVLVIQKKKSGKEKKWFILTVFMYAYNVLIRDIFDFPFLSMFH